MDSSSMKSIIIDDNLYFAKELSKLLLDPNILLNEDCPSSNYSTYRLAEEVSKKILSIKNEHKETITIFINIEGMYGAANRQNQKGIEILLWLRCKHRIKNPVVLFSFQNIHQLLKKIPEHFIINSEGSYFIQLPYDFAKLNMDSFKPLKNLDSLKKYLKPAFSIDEFRHQEANWWGIKSLWDVHKVATSGEFKLEYPDLVKKKLSELNNCIANFCFSAGVVRLDDFIGNKKEVLNRELRLKEIELINKKNEYVTEEEAYKYYSSELDKINAQNWLKRGLNRVVKFLQGNNYNEEYSETQLIVTNSKEKLESITLCINTITENIKTTQKSLDNLEKTVKGELSITPKSLSKKDIKVLHIDDQANDGWNEIIKFIVYGQSDSTNYFSLDFNSKIKRIDNIEDKIHELYNQIKNILVTIDQENSSEIDVILLDLRLIPSYDETQKNSIENMSGARLLKKLKEEFAGIPIIVTTASNKILTYEKIVMLGADAYWVKEGLDEQRNAVAAVSNYINFVNLIRKIVSEEYIFLKHLWNEINMIKTRDTFWWLKNNPWQKKIEKKQIIFILETIYKTLRIYLQQNFSKSGDLQSFWLRAAINQINGIIEIIHGSYESEIIGGKYEFDKEKRKHKFIDYGRKDWIAFLFVRTRNSASHQRLGAKLDDFTIFEPLLSLLFFYLNGEEYTQLQEPKLVNFNLDWNTIKRSLTEFIKLNNISPINVQ